ncbi:type II toxin-antitoxin system RelE family toxin [Aphanothece sacrum]|uniref:Plasmid stabilization protein n=1 Tax=Aphanothece sacrum FPU1 TaxID=1920663 RepID=A0A401IGS7_APHSA|nr:type II toxin-antitoxin system RelE/ParE family toxin [Aphanothece sacrum]GBF80400.1 plasmid stabilization protein [Aphanothece sacrum FPU1]GBF84893.1 plasmid stabilization protein [Aphanothece sacrum FPU3]
MYDIEFSKTAIKRLRNLPINWSQRIAEKLQEIASNPYGKHNNVKKLIGRPGYRLRVGDWRIIYEIDGEKLKILVLEIGTRGKIYS